MAANYNRPETETGKPVNSFLFFKAAWAGEGAVLPWGFAKSKARILQLVAEARMEEALEALRKAVPAEHENDVVLLMARHERLNKSERTGIIANADSSVERNRIAAATLELCEML